MTRLVADVKECAFSLTCPMSSSTSEPRQTSPPYAALRSTGETITAAPPPASTAVPKGPAADTSYWRQEADKVDVLLQTLWSGFLEADANGLPTALVDYVSAYTGAMRLKLTLMGYSAVPNRAFKAAAAVNGKGRVP